MRPNRESTPSTLASGRSMACASMTRNSTLVKSRAAAPPRPAVVGSVGGEATGTLWGGRALLRPLRVSGRVVGALLRALVGDAARRLPRAFVGELLVALARRRQLGPRPPPVAARHVADDQH